MKAWVEWFGAARLVLTTVAVAAVVGGAVWLLRTPPPPTEAILPVATTQPATTSSTSGPSSASGSPAIDPVAAPSTLAPGPVVVHVAGAVHGAGVHQLNPGARVGDAVEAAGGATADADLDRLNLAAPLTDGQRVYVPLVGGPVVSAVVDPPTPPPADDRPQPSLAAAPVDLNRATAAELERLPGIGPATAAAIVAHRERNGPFRSVDALDDVSGIGPAKLETIRPLVTV